MPQRTGRRQETAGKGNKKTGKEKPKRQRENRKAGLRASNYQGPRAGQSGTGGTGYGTDRAAWVIQKYLEPQRERDREIQRKKKEIMASKARKG